MVLFVVCIDEANLEIIKQNYHHNSRHAHAVSTTDGANMVSQWGVQIPKVWSS
jgi:hypothetical protein